MPQVLLSLAFLCHLTTSFRCTLTTCPLLSFVTPSLRQVIYDVDDRNALINPRQGVPHSDLPLSGKQDVFRFHSDPSAIVHNPYPCFGAPGLVWPRGFPLNKVQPEESSICSLEGAMDSQVIGVVQALANHYPDVDAIYRMTYPPGGLPFAFAAKDSSKAETRDLRVVPTSTFTPYNAQVGVIVDRGRCKMTSRRERTNWALR